MRLSPYAEHDFELTEALDGDPAVMRDLGGAVPADRLPAVHERRLNPPAGDRYLTVRSDASEHPLGLVGLWRTPWDGTTVAEAGVLVRREYVGTGLGVRALKALFDLLIEEGVTEPVHAFIAADNWASNLLARRMGFTHAEARQILCGHHFHLHAAAGPGARHHPAGRHAAPVRGGRGHRDRRGPAAAGGVGMRLRPGVPVRPLPGDQVEAWLDAQVGDPDHVGAR